VPSARPAAKPAPTQVAKATDRPGTADKAKNVSRPGDNNASRPGDKNIKTGDRNINSGNRDVSIDNSRKNVNINIDNSHDVNVRRNTVVRPAPRPYVRPPYRYGGFGYYSFHPYYYHPYRPFVWGPMWHPWGFFVATLATTAIVVSLNSQQYHYDQGVFYTPTTGGYTVVTAPVGATVPSVPSNATTVTNTNSNNTTVNNYYYGGTYYEKSDKGYTVVSPQAGTLVPELPEGGEEVTIGEQKYVKFGETYYQPVQVDGKEMFEVVEVKKE